MTLPKTTKTLRRRQPNYLSYASMIALLGLIVFVAVVTFSSAQATLDHVVVAIAFAAAATSSAVMSLHFKD